MDKQAVPVCSVLSTVQEKELTIGTGMTVLPLILKSAAIAMQYPASIIPLKTTIVGNQGLPISSNSPRFCPTKGSGSHPVKSANAQTTQMGALYQKPSCVAGARSFAGFVIPTVAQNASITTRVVKMIRVNSCRVASYVPKDDENEQELKLVELFLHNLFMSNQYQTV